MTSVSLVVAPVKNLWFLRPAVQQQLSNVVFAVEEVCMYIFFVFALPTRTSTVSGGGAQVSLSRAVPTTANKLRPRATCERASTSVVRWPRSYGRVRWLRAGMSRYTVLRRLAHEGRVRPNATGLAMS